MKTLIIAGILSLVTTFSIDKAEAHRSTVVSEIRLGPLGFYTSERARHYGDRYKYRYGRRHKPRWHSRHKWHKPPRYGHVHHRKWKKNRKWKRH